MPPEQVDRAHDSLYAVLRREVIMDMFRVRKMRSRNKHIPIIRHRTAK